MKNSTLSRLLLVLGLCISISNVRAQYVSIPDSNFGNWLLYNGYSSCLTGNSVSGFRLDTTCSALASADTVICSYSNLYDLTGLQYFHNMQWLDCGDNHLSFLPTLPSSLTYLVTNNNPLYNLPSLPDSILFIFCDSNRLSSLPTLPSQLITIYCDSNFLTSLPALPAGMQNLVCDYNQLTTLPALPMNMNTIYCNYNRLTSLPAFPTYFSSLFCDGNNLTSLPTLDTFFFQLHIGYNPIRTLPALPSGMFGLEVDGDTLYSLPALPSGLNYLSCGYAFLSALPTPLPSGLTSLECDGNALGTLPALPPNLNYLSCYNDQLTSLPALPNGITTFYCQSNQLSSIPNLPDSMINFLGDNNPSLSCLPLIYQKVLQNFYIYGCNITCLPNAFNAIYYDIDPATMPICVPGSGCGFYYNISGNIHSDTSASCSLDSLYPGTPITDMKVQLVQNGQVVQQFYTFTGGQYSFEATPPGDYTISIDTTGLPLTVACPSSDSQYVSLTATDSVAIGINFGLQCASTDFGVGYIWGHHFRPTFTTQVHIGAGNIARLKYSIDCGAGTSGTVTTTYAGPITYVAPAAGALTPTSVSGNVLTYNIANLDSLTFGSLDIIVLTDTGAVAGTDACFTTIITPAIPDINPYDDTLTRCFTIVHSWDPNHKDVTPTGLTEAPDWLTYTIDFQNTGTDTAYNITVRDTLSQYVDASTFQYLASSNKPVIQLFGNIVVFTFPHINLADSATNLPLSEAWVQYRVKTIPNLPVNTLVNNTAYVYFDQNPAVVTNTATSGLYPAGIKPVSSNGPIRLYPNPNKGTFTLTTSGRINSDYTISDMLGNIITQQTITSESQMINLSDAAGGVYTLSVKGLQPLRFVVVR